MVSLSDQQLGLLMDTARAIDPDRRDIFLQRVGAMLRLRHRFSDADVAEVSKLALYGLVHDNESAA
jgi:hypothetical protein